MSLRLRFALYALLVMALALSLTTLAMREALGVFLLDRIVRETEQLLEAVVPRLVADEEGSLFLDLDGGFFSSLRPDTLVLLVDREGVRDAVGFLPPLEELQRIARKEAPDHLVRERRVGELTLLGARHLGEMRQMILLVDRLLPWALLLGGGAAFLVALGLASKALAPLAQATEAALGLARDRAWQRRLPLPQGQDEVAQMVEAFNSVLEVLEEALEAERRFAREAAHALRTPLTILLGQLERGRTDEARAQAERLGRLVESLLLMARAEVTALTRVPLELDLLVFTEVESLRPAFSAKGLRLSLELPEGSVLVLGSEEALRGVVVALLENALQHTARGGRVEAGVRGEAFWVTNAPSHPQPGSGLGLRLATALLRAQGGRLEVEHQGQVFSVRAILPPFTNPSGTKPSL
jgi:signal transduction histidine kinase